MENDVMLLLKRFCLAAALLARRQRHGHAQLCAGDPQDRAEQDGDRFFGSATLMAVNDIHAKIEKPH